MATFGNTNVETGNNIGVTDYKLGYQATLAENGAVTSISVYSVSDGRTAKAFIYSDDTNQPKTLLALSPETASVTTAWVTFTFASPVALAAGNYWLGIISPDGFTGRYAATGGLHDTGGGAGTDVYVDGPADPWDSHVGAGTRKVSVYATYSPYLGTGALTIGSPSIAGEGPLPRTGTGALQFASVSIAGAGHGQIFGAGALQFASPTIGGTMWMDSAHLRHIAGRAWLYGARGKASLYGLKGKAEL